MVLFSGMEVNAQDRDDRDYGSGRDDDRYENRESKSYLRVVKRGYRDGLREGISDARRGGRGYKQSRLYRDLTDGYDPRRGGWSAYQRAYRTGFQRGYRDGLNGDRNN
jgi:hypothetical protein